jgi:hypothetical protein
MFTEIGQLMLQNYTQGKMKESHFLAAKRDLKEDLIKNQKKQKHN